MSQRTVASASSASTSYPCYDVFINHRGPDCKHTFATRLYRCLRNQGLQVFLDEQELIEGYNITSQLEAAIRGSSVQVAVFSPTYATSEWCLNELVLMVKSGATILPVFYGVEPSVLRWTVKGGAYYEALENLQQKITRDPKTGKEKPRYDSETIQSWRDALSHVADISGFVMRGDEYDLLEKVVQGVVKKVPKVPLDVAKYPTGLGEKLQDFERRVLSKQEELNTIGKELKSVGARVAAIVGTGGVGKTTLAKHFFNLKRAHYKESVFLLDVRETARTMSLSYLQSKLIQELKHTDIKIKNPDQGIWELKKHLSSCHALIILDDVDDADQMEKLSSMKDSLSPQSLILVTSRDKHVLRSSGLENESIYNLEGLSIPDSKDLFCCHAFHQRDPPQVFAALVNRFVRACDGLPLSLKVFGATVCGRQQSYWKELLDQLQKRPPTEIQNRLRISYEKLEKEDQKIFLDIVCFFTGEEIDTAIRIWGMVGLENLESKCLLEVDSKKKIKMHDQIRDMGRIIAQEESMPRRFSQIDDFLEQTSSHVVTKVRGISMVPRVPHSLLFSSPSHLKDPRWKLFNKNRYDCINLEILATEGGYLNAILRTRTPSVPLPWLRCLEAILRIRTPSVPLRWLRWYHCPHSSFPSWIPMDNLRVLEVAGSELKMLWQDESQAPLQLRELNIFSPLSHFPSSIGHLTRLEKIFVGHENRILPLKSLPEEFCNLQSLKCLILQRCSEMVSLPESFGKLTNLQRINLNQAFSLITLPNSFGDLTNLDHFEMSGAYSWETLPIFFGNLANLRHFTLLNASSFQTLPRSFENLRNLEHFKMSGASSWETFPSFFGNLKNLQHFTLLDASRLKPLPNSFGNLINLQHLELSGVSSWETLPNCFGNLTNLQNFTVLDASMLEKLPDSFENLRNLQHFELSGASRLKTLKCFENFTNINISLSDLSSLQTLLFGNLTNANINLAVDFKNVNGASSLETLQRPILSGDLSHVSISIQLSGASSMGTVPLPNFLGNLAHVNIDVNWSGASSLGTLPLPNFLGNLAHVVMRIQLQDVNGASSLETLPRPIFSGDLSHVYIGMSGVSGLGTLPLPNFLGNLEHVRMSIELQDVNGASSLETLPRPIFSGDLSNVCIHMSGVSSLGMLPLPNFLGNLEHVDILIQLQDVNGASSLETLPRPVFAGDLSNVRIHMSGVSSLGTLPLPHFLGNLEDINIWIHLQDVNGASSLETLPRPIFSGDLSHVDILMSGVSSLGTLPLPNFLGNLEHVRMSIELQDVNGASSLETLPRPIFSGDLSNVIINMSRVSSLGTLPLPHFLGNLADVDMSIHLEDVNGASSLETLPPPIFSGDLSNVTISMLGASSLGTLPSPYFLGNFKLVGCFQFGDASKSSEGGRFFNFGDASA